MDRTLAWLVAHRKMTTAIALCYFLVNVLTHDVAQAIAKWIQDALTPATTNLIITIAAVIALVVATSLVLMRVKDSPHKALKLTYCCATAILVGLCYARLFMVNTESVHFPQYAILAMLIFPILRRFGATVFIVTILGAVDEAYQYWVLSRDWELYFDFNDIILNLLGAAIGLLVVLLLTRPAAWVATRSSFSPTAFVRSSIVLLAVGGSVFTLVLTLMGQIALYADSGAWIVLRRIGPPTDFWMLTEWGKTCHILMPTEGVALAFVLIALYAYLDWRIEWTLETDS